MLPKNFKYYGNWGFSIYRTYYSPDSDEHWDVLLDALRRQTSLALGYYEDTDEDGDDLMRLKKLFRLDPREDPSVLGGLDLRQLREVCLHEHPGAEETMAGRHFYVVLVADESVLKDIAKGEFVVKAVSYDWVKGCENWGWMRVPTGYLLELWHSLMLWVHNNTHRALRFDGPEEDLHEYIWPGDSAANPSGKCSEIRPGLFHYSAQRSMFSVQKKSK
ncbi:hypothetical protein FDECE_11753 [Fusarium decemcellulare]|nr:hypothetical protein FDECE_11753 [Fusarium decemcellulare]